MDILAQLVQARAEKAARTLHPDLPYYEQVGLTRARRGSTSYIKEHIIILGYGELVAEIADGDETLRAIRWKLGDGIHTWDELPDIPGPKYAFFSNREASKWPRKSKEASIGPRNSVVKTSRRRVIYMKRRRGTTV